MELKDVKQIQCVKIISVMERMVMIIVVHMNGISNVLMLQFLYHHVVCFQPQ